ncbi:heptaprenylglyceryl phosphate synthase [Paenibacillus sp. N1-5-1-14]|uniref:heptaprenylglyceryl phosphate synthase n=1 Tax=Paenibacillus radicibacter TaxID=2972488 RepID=UPI0021596E48|nr:heptaprenylglyceryl phosphate synthase [Paenibacillus radicibacter]MCR8644963.1 heptaprenylglyceryl phosphate synthase [Paenibacillus radicibacter]
MIIDTKSWRHVFKLDPDKQLTDEQLEHLCVSGTDGIMVGGSTGVTYENTVDLLARIRQYEVPCVLEVSHRDAIVPGFDMYMIPVVLNSGDPQWIVGQQMEAIAEYGSLMDWDEILTEGYIILNGDSAAAKLTSAQTDISEREVVAYARMAEQMFKMPICYVEYSGTFGDMDIVRQVKRNLRDTQLMYGGGINSLEKAKLAGEAADTIIVGNIIYEDFNQALATVAGCQSM